MGLASDDTESKASAVTHEFAPKLDPHGFPLRPQPSDDPLDPLNWSTAWKLVVLLQVSFLGFLGPFSQGTVNSAFGPLSKDMHVTISEASYSTTIAIVFAGIFPLIWSPLANCYGRRPVFLGATAIGIAATAGSAVASSWGSLLVARAFVGIGTSVSMGIGATVVSDLYFMHERGTYMGIYVVFVTNGAHIAAIVGGFTAKYVDWRWCYWVPAITLGATWLINLVLLPETLYHRDPSTGMSRGYTESWWQLLSLTGTPFKRHPAWWDFTHCFLMLKYPSVVLAGLYYSIAFGVGTVLFAVTGAAAFGSIYGFDTAQVGLAIGLSTTVGSVIGELSAGHVSDQILYLSAKRHAGEPKCESRLQTTWPGSFLLPAGVIIGGLCLQYKTHWSGPVVGIGIGSFGLQIVSTSIFAYLTDCYKPQSTEISTLLNTGRLLFSFTLGFYMVPFAQVTTWGIAWSVMAIICVVLYGGIVLLMWKGPEWREHLGRPNFDRDL
ncbi:hypothetical protein VTN00DRAFT_3490 [Thermoascus crustaceus]|uniref:uncharacterized protein n=1 Tax=Thermoascus crustaceus TaxID=5088 RepID=UPI0037440166